MSNLEYADHHEHKYTPTPEEWHEINNANRIHKALTGTLAPTTKEWLRKNEGK